MCGEVSMRPFRVVIAITLVISDYDIRRVMRNADMRLSQESHNEARIQWYYRDTLRVKHSSSG
jgi:hypothetical protein